MSDKDIQNTDEAAIGRLLRNAGRGPTASPDARKRIYNATQAEWRNSVAAGRRGPERDRTGLRPGIWSGGWLFRGFAVAASLAVVVAVLFALRAPSPEIGAEFATVAKAVGTVTITDAGGADARLLADGLDDQTIRIGESLATGAMGAVSISLDDGPVLRVDASSELYIAAADSIELQRGAVYIDTGAGNESAPDLRVETALGSVRHVGTQYEVRIGGDDLSIRVREGAVAFSDSSREFLGEAGEQLVVARSGPPSRSTIATNGPGWEWVERLAVAPDADELLVIDLLEWVARETGREIEFADGTAEAAARQNMLSGFSGFTPAETLDVVASTTALRFESSGDTLLVR